jgi:hypothetical protein
MLPLKDAVNCVTLSTAMFFALWELKLKRELTDGLPKPSENVSDLGILSDLHERLRRERFLRGLPRQARSKLKIVASLKFLFVVVLIIEVFVLQKP